jgi:hypothetical protein
LRSAALRGRRVATFIREDSVADQIAAGVAANPAGPPAVYFFSTMTRPFAFWNTR